MNVHFNFRGVTFESVTNDAVLGPLGDSLPFAFSRATRAACAVALHLLVVSKVTLPCRPSASMVGLPFVDEVVADVEIEAERHSAQSIYGTTDSDLWIKVEPSGRHIHVKQVYTFAVQTLEKQDMSSM